MMIHGHYFKDTIYYCKGNLILRKSSGAGGVHNLCKIIPEYVLNSTLTNKALFFIDIDTLEKKCFVEWVDKNISQSFSNKWNHYCYIDELYCRLNPSVHNSIDFCTSLSHNNNENLHHNIYCSKLIFVSDNEKDWLNVINHYRKDDSFVIYHTKNSIHVNNKLVCKITPSKFINTIGAGDFLAAYIINDVSNGCDIIKAVKQAIPKVEKELCRQNQF